VVTKLASIGAVALAACFAASVTPASVARTSCGLERWPVKTLADPGAPHVALTPKLTTIEALRNRTVTVGIGGARGIGTERTTFRVKARLVELKVEADDDVHLVIADPQTGGTMIAEFPAAVCTHGATAKVRALMQKARTALVLACGFAPNTNFRPIQGTATIDGVGFFDFLHHQSGNAPNGIELHPVLRFVGRCS
jgi:hypothetical protein